MNSHCKGIFSAVIGLMVLAVLGVAAPAAPGAKPAVYTTAAK